MKRKFYITTSIAYTNAPPHLGFALELVQADVLARYHRLLGEEVFFLTGTDEHGAKIVRAAREARTPVASFVRENAMKFRKLARVLGISNDGFIRTTDRSRHWPAVAKVWQKLERQGDIYKKIYRGLYCVGHEAFITKKDLREGKCVLHGKRPEHIEEENYFFRLSNYTRQIQKMISSDTFRIVPPARKNEILSFMKRGFEDVSFSRPRKDLAWGIPVPGDSSQTIYVWADALTNYLSALGYAQRSKQFLRFWPADVQCIGKDIVKFHAGIWPGMLLSLGLPLPKTLFVHGFITVGGRKMSKSLGNVVDPFGLVEKYGADAVRYYLLREIPPTEDGDFTIQKFEERYHADLAKGLGNLVARVGALALKCKMQNTKYKMTNQSAKFLYRARKNYQQSLDEFRFHEALEAIWDVISWCDRYIDKERPWETQNQNSKIKNQKVIYNLLFMLAHIGSMLQPFLPETSEKIFRQLGARSTARAWKFRPQRGPALFPRVK